MQLRFTRALFSFIALAALAALPWGLAGTHSVAAAQRKPAAKKKAAVVYSCPMDPEVKSNKPGQCPKCGMALRPVKKAETTGHEGHAHEAETTTATGTAAASATGAAAETPLKGTT
ncbi:MAG TPA: heavy metal-binding domain-containing protein, partial [Pyrinomonadaceae bacterium]|nr:heavy metal-binding domain-containing protein [Pyrinomonadaceae bacterium]